METLRPFAASLRRLYHAHMVSSTTILALKEAGKITEDEYRQIMDEEV